ncbi:MAG: TIGR01777 family oxidoreductase [Bacteroidales bacterium]|nr:TIGR01777 family oxidoreductase [Bacteroidales bacterium]MBN2757055.1 TIGR01777 family oxidoreductase [Bacteroidales bacterium]
MDKNILIAGGTGLVGTELSKLLTQKGYNVAVLSRNKNFKVYKSFYWNYEQGILDVEAIEFADVIINLTGENISNKRWTKKQKEIIIDSRIKTTNLIFEKTKSAKNKPITYISASAIGYYGTFTSEKIFTEEDKAGNDFLAKTGISWEKSADQFNLLNIRTLKLRIGVVFSKNGGALPKIIKPVKFGIGSAIGKGKQYIPWIEISDLARIFLFIIENKNTNSVYNAVSPNFISNYELTKSLAKILKKPFFFPNIPAFIMKLIFGEMSSILIKGSRVSSDKIQKEGFEFKFKNIEDIFTDLM